MNNENSKKSILIIDDHPMIVEITKWRLLNIDRTLQIISCDTAQTGLAAFGERDDWFRIFLDLDVPGAHGLSLARQFAHLGAAQKCAVITTADNAQWQAEVMALRMLGYIVKSTSLKKLSFLLEEILNGRTVFSKTQLRPPASVQLTPRQQDVLCLLCRGHASKDIALLLGLSIGTVDNYIFSLLHALGAKNRAQAVAKGIELGYINFSNTALLAGKLEMQHRDNCLLQRAET